jgi:hypothetical protein
VVVVVGVSVGTALVGAADVLGALVVGVGAAEVVGTGASLVRPPSSSVGDASPPG